MVRVQLSERQSSRIQVFLRSERRAGRPGHDERRFVEAVLWWRRTGVPWRDLPSEFGPWKTVFNRFDRWAKRGKWARLFLALQTDRDDEWHSLDSTINRAHQHASGGKGGPRPMASVDRAGDSPRRSTLLSMRLACRCSLRLQRASGTISNPRRGCSKRPRLAVC